MTITNKSGSWAYYINLIVPLFIISQQLLACYIGQTASAGLLCVAVILASHGMRWTATLYRYVYALYRAYCSAWCGGYSVVAIERNAHEFQDDPYCPMCGERIPDRACYLYGIDPDTGPVVIGDHKVYNLAGYGHCETCDNYWTMFERTTVAASTGDGSQSSLSPPVTVGYNVIPHFEKRWQYTWSQLSPQKESGDHNDKTSHYCNDCGLQTLHHVRPFVARGYGWGPLAIATNWLSIDTCMQCHRASWVSV